MGNEYHCPDCGLKEKDCECFVEETIEETIDGCFRFEYQHEGCSMYGTVFKKVLPYSDN